MIISPGELTKRAEEAAELYSPCTICPRGCGADRLAGETGECGETADLRIAAAVPHFGEEPPLTGEKGVGNIFFTGCNLSCVYCQNHQASQGGFGEVVTPAELAGKMLDFRRAGLESVGLVTPSHAVPGILKAVAAARDNGFRLPLIYNTNSFDRVETLKYLEGVIAVYLADLRYSDDSAAKRYSGAENYAAISRRAVEEMFRQVGAFQGHSGNASFGGLIVRILVLPDNLAGVWDTLCFVALELSRKIPISLMSQYQPLHKAGDYPELNRCVTETEYHQALDMARELGFDTIFTQELNPAKHLAPDFENIGAPFKTGS